MKIAIVGPAGAGKSTISKVFSKAGFTVVDEGLKTLWNPDDMSRKTCVEYGQKLAKTL